MYCRGVEFRGVSINSDPHQISNVLIFFFYNKFPDYRKLRAKQDHFLLIFFFWACLEDMDLKKNLERMGIGWSVEGRGC